MTEYAANDVVVMTHPMFDRHIVAEIVTVAKATCTVRYIMPTGVKSDKPLRRNLDAIVAKVPDGKDPRAIALVMKNLASIRDEIVRRANVQYISNVKSYGEQV